MNWISGYFYFQPLFTSNLWRLLTMNSTKTYPCLVRRNFREITWKYLGHTVSSFWCSRSLNCCLENAIISSSLTTTNLAAKTNILQDKQTRPSQQNLKNQELYLSQYCHSCYIWKIRHLDSGCSGRIDSTSVLVLDQTLITRPCNKWWYGVGAPTHCRILHVIETEFFL